MTDRKVVLSVSKDGGHNDGDEREQSLGKLGAYRQPVRFRRFGMARDFAAKIRVTSPISADFMGMIMDYEVADG